MTLAVILGLGTLLAAPLPPNAHTQPPLVSQATQPQPDAPQSNPQQPASQPQPTPQPGSQQEPSQSPQQDAKPDQPAAPQPAPAQNSGQQPEPSQPGATAGKPESKPTPAKKSRKRGKKTGPAAQPSDGPTKIVVRNGSTPDPEVQLSPGLSQEQASHQRQNTSQLLTNTEANLKKISGRQLNASEQDMVKQVRMYMDQARMATDSGDLQRAHNLAFKAHLLSDELLRH